MFYLEENYAFIILYSQKAMSKSSGKDFANPEKNTKKFKVSKTSSKKTREVAGNSDSYDFWTWLTTFIYNLQNLNGSWGRTSS